MSAPPSHVEEQQLVEQLRDARGCIARELGKAIIGQNDVVEEMLIALFSGGHCMITGVPGLAKTLLIKSLAQIFDLKFQRIQFTPDLMPADITGTEILGESETGRRMVFVKGPIFANIVLADEINRTPPKTQAALLEAMQEHQVTAAGVRYALDEPFFVLATKNPIEMEGTYPLPEAQLDRFMFDIVIDYLREEDEIAVILQTTAAAPEPITQLYSGADLQNFQRLVRKVPIAQEVASYAVRLAAASRPAQKNTAGFVNDFVSWGAGLRAGQYMVLGAKARALLHGRAHATLDDIRALAQPTLRHRILPNYRAEAEGMTVTKIIERLLESVPKM